MTSVVTVQTTRSMLHVILLAASAFALAWPGMVGAQQVKPDTRLEKLEQELEKQRLERESLEKKAQSLKKDIETYGNDLVKAAAVIQNFEAEILLIEERLPALMKEEREKTRRLKRRRQQTVHVLLALQRLARHPPESMIVQNMNPDDMVRSAILLRAAVPRIESQAELLRQDVFAVSLSRREMMVQREALATAIRGLKSERRQLKDLLEQKARIRNETVAASRQIQMRADAIAREAGSLRDLMARLDDERRLREQKTRKSREAAALRAQRKAEATARVRTTQNVLGAGAGKSISKARGRLPFPAVGRIVARYGQSTETGLTRKGITIETRANAQVVAPYDGEVVFSGVFRGYGQLLIIEHSEGYHSLLAGMDIIDGVIGQIVLAGEPVGIMGNPDKGKPSLYVEIRRNGQPINPLPWLAALKGKVNG
ncbi:MAG: peptidoglycan DD-metalloendopeptidase family protein [Rhodospirillales bacterium]|nr:peptidoglycan DD-metalloendopeptidase family protein [Rhodospirillales bacterium]